MNSPLTIPTLNREDKVMTLLSSVTLTSTETYPKHGSEVGVPEPEGDVGDVETLWSLELLRRVLVDVVVIHDRRRDNDATRCRHCRHVRRLTHVL